MGRTAVSGESPARIIQAQPAQRKNKYMKCPHLSNSMDQVLITIGGPVVTLREYIDRMRHVASGGSLDDREVHLVVISDYLPDRAYIIPDTRTESGRFAESPEYVVLDKVMVTAGEITYTLNQFLRWMREASLDGWFESNRVVLNKEISL